MSKKNNIPQKGDDAWELANFLAKSSAVYAFRNGPIEDIHAEGRLSQEEMKILNQNMAKRLGEVFYLMNKGRTDDLIRLFKYPAIFSRGWDDIDLSELEERIHPNRSAAPIADIDVPL